MRASKSDSKPWAPDKATREIQAIARSKALTLSYKLHAKERIAELGLTTSDVLFVLKNGFVYEEPEPATRSEYNRYKIESLSPNSGRRKVGLVVIPDKAGSLIKIVTVMWIDERATRAGSIVGVEDD